MKPRRNLFLGSFLVAFSMAQVASAGVKYWDADGNSTTATGGTGTWTTANTWRTLTSTGTLGNWANYDDAVFGGTAGTVTLSGTTQANSLQFDTTGYLISGSTIQLGNPAAPGLYVVTGGSASISSAFTNSGAGNAIHIGKAGYAGTLTLTNFSGLTANNRALAIDYGNLYLSTATTALSGTSGGVSIASGATLTYDNSGTVNWGPTSTTNLTGTGTLVKKGAGNLIFGLATGSLRLNVNFSTGAVIDLQVGSIESSSNYNGVWTNNYADLNVASGATFNLKENKVYIGALTGAGTVQQSYTCTGPSLTIGRGDRSGLFSGVIKNNGYAASVEKLGSGTQTLSGVNTFTGGLTITAGTIKTGIAGALGGTSNGSVTINGGTLDLNGISSQQIGILTGSSGTILNSLDGTTATFVIGGSNLGGGDFAGSIADNAGGAATGKVAFSKVGSATATLSGTNTYTGLTTISGGTLRAGSNSAFTNKGGLSMSSNGTFDLNGFNAVFTTFASASTNIITNSSSATGASNASAIGTPSGADVYVDTLTFSSIFPTTGTTIAAKVTDGATRLTQLVINNATSSQNLGGITNTANSFSGGLVLAYTSGSGTRLRINSAITGTPFGSGPIIIGQTAADKAQILIDSAAAATLSNPIFINTALGSDAIGAFRVDTTGHILSGKITANLADARFATGASKTASVSLTGQVTGDKGLILDTGAGTTLLTVTLNNATPNANNYKGNTIINQGAATGRSATLKLAASNQIPTGTSAGNVTITTSGTGVGTLDLNGFNQQINGLDGSGTLDGNIAGVASSNILTVGDNDQTSLFSGTIKSTLGTLGLTKTGSGTLTLSGTNTYSGGTNIKDGSIIIGGGNDRILTTGTVVLGDFTTNGKLVIGDGTDRTQTLAGLTTTGLGGSVVGGAAANSTLTLNIASGTNIFGGKIGGTLTNENNVALTKIGAGTLELSGANTYAGNTLFGTAVGTSTGVLRLADKDALGTGKLIINNGNTDTGTVELTGGINVANNIDFFGRSASTTAAIIRNVSGDNTLSGVLTGSLNGGNYNFHSDAGTLTISNKITSSATGSQVLNLRGTGAINVSGSIEDGTAAMRIQALDAGNYTLGGNNSYTGSTTLANGTLNVSSLANGGSNSNIGASTNAASNLVFDGGTMRYTGTSVVSDRAFTISAAKTATIEVVTSGESLSLAGATGAATTGALNKTGAGTLTLSGTNTYTGTTTVTSGTLVINGNISTLSTTTVKDTGTLGGKGTTGAITVESGGKLAPGNRIDSLTASGDVNLASGSTFEVEIDKDRSYDIPYINLDGVLDITSGAKLSLLDFGSASLIALNSRLRLIDYTSVGGAWNGGLFTLGTEVLSDSETFVWASQNWLINYDDTLGAGDTTLTNGGKYVTLTVIPEPSTALLGILSSLALLRRRR